MPRDKDLEKKRRRTTRNPRRRDLMKPLGTKKRDKRDVDTVDSVRDPDLRTGRVARFLFDSFLIQKPSKLVENEQKDDLMKNLSAALVNNVAEFRPGQMVFLIYPVARPFVGVVTAANRVEGKVYVSWNGRVTQHDPEELQPVSYTPFFTYNTGGRLVSASEKGTFEGYVEALRDVKRGQDLRSSLMKHGFNEVDASSAVKRIKEARENKNADISPPLPQAGEAVVLLSDGGQRPGAVGLLVAVEGRNGIVDLSTSWTSKRDGSNLVEVPLCSLVPVESSSRTTINGRFASEDGPERVVKTARALSFVGSQNFTYNVGKQGVKVTTTITSDGVGNERATVLAESYGDGENKLLFSKNVDLEPADMTKLRSTFSVEASLERIKTVVEDAKSAALQYVRERMMPQYVDDQQAEFLGRPETISVTQQHKK